jgi:hypothetical protein
VGRSRSFVWKHMHLEKKGDDKEGEMRVVCTAVKDCGWTQEMGVGTGTSNLITHLLVKHGIVAPTQETDGASAATIATSTAVGASPQGTLVDFGFTRHLSTVESVKQGVLDYLIASQSAFNVLTYPQWQHLMGLGKLASCCPKTMTRFMLESSAQLRLDFKKVLVRCPGVSVAVDEWSDRALMPWMGIVINTVDLDFNMLEHCPGLQSLDQAATSTNLLRWFQQQLARMSILTKNLASVCTDNAANISKAMSLDDDLKGAQQHCIAHLLNIGVQKATRAPLQPEELKEVCKGAEVAVDDFLGCGAVGVPR